VSHCAGATGDRLGTAAGSGYHGCTFMISIRFTSVLRYGWLALACLSLLCACGEQPSGAIRFGLASAPATLDPRFATDAASERINRLLYARLVDYDAQSRPVASLATWEEQTPTHYRFRLGSDGRLFHNGQRLNARDVAATYRSVLDRDTASPLRATLSMVERVEVIDDDTLDFHLKRPDSLFPGFLTVGVLPADSIDAAHPFHELPIGSGPFRLRDWPQSGRLSLERLRDGQVFEFEQVSDPTMRVLKLLRGEIDLLQNDLPPELLGYLAQRAEIRIERTPGSNFVYLGFQLQDRDSGRLAVRQAVALAIDRQAIIEHVFQGAARPASALLPPEHWAGAPGLPVLESDPQQARHLLAQAGYGPGRPLRLSYKTSSDPFRVRIATIVQQQLARAGIDVAVQSYDWGTFYGDIKAGRFQMYSLAWVGIRSPDIFRHAFHSEAGPPAGANRGRLRDAEVDRLIEQAQQADSQTERVAVYRTLQRRLLDLLPYVPLWYEDQYAAVSDRIRGYTIRADGAYDSLLATARNP
jgi:peptide/nickel transport system substrate-binding protein